MRSHSGSRKASVSYFTTPRSQLSQERSFLGYLAILFLDVYLIFSQGIPALAADASDASLVNNGPHHGKCETTCGGVSSYINGYCSSVENSSIFGRCCVLNGTTVIGIDLRACNTSEVADDVQLLADPAELRWIDLSDSSAENVFGGNVSSESVPNSFMHLKGLAKLKVLLLPSGSECPGPDGTWRNQTVTVLGSEPSGVMCSGPVSACSPEGEQLYFGNRSACSTSSQCVPNGPGFRLCECRTGYWGYRCLRKGRFPVGTFVTAMVGSVLGIVLLPQICKFRRKKAKKVPLRSTSNRVWSFDGDSVDMQDTSF